MELSIIKYGTHFLARKIFIEADAFSSGVSELVSIFI